MMERDDLEERPARGPRPVSGSQSTRLRRAPWTPEEGRTISPSWEPQGCPEGQAGSQAGWEWQTGSPTAPAGGQRSPGAMGRCPSASEVVGAKDRPG